MLQFSEQPQKIKNHRVSNQAHLQSKGTTVIQSFTQIHGVPVTSNGCVKDQFSNEKQTPRQNVFQKSTIVKYLDKIKQFRDSSEIQKRNKIKCQQSSRTLLHHDPLRQQKPTLGKDRSISGVKRLNQHQTPAKGPFPQGDDSFQQESQKLQQRRIEQQKMQLSMKSQRIMGINQFTSSILDSSEKPVKNQILFSERKERVQQDYKFKDEKKKIKTPNTSRRNESNVDLKFDPSIKNQKPIFSQYRKYLSKKNQSTMFEEKVQQQKPIKKIQQKSISSLELDNIGSSSKVLEFKGKQIKQISSRENLNGILKFKKTSLSVISVEKSRNSQIFQRKIPQASAKDIREMQTSRSANSKSPIPSKKIIVDKNKQSDIFSSKQNSSFNNQPQKAYKNQQTYDPIKGVQIQRQARTSMD